MIVTTVNVERTFNLGNYESLKVGFSAILSETDKPLEATRDLEMLAQQHFENRQASKPKPAAPAPQPKPQQPQQKDTSRQGDTCPQCGAKKKPGFILCYNCYEAEKAN
jgi:hypothetical protein